MTQRFATLPMYDFPNVRLATNAWWSGLARHLTRAGVAGTPAGLLRGDDLPGQWLDPAMLLSQTCGYLLTHQLAGRVVAVAAPHYSALGCDGADYASVVLVRESHPGRALADFRGSNAVYSRIYSHAGYNAFRAMIAPLAGAAPFFASVGASGSHLASIAAVADGRADIAMIDAVIYGFLSRWQPELLIGTRSLGYGPSAPAPPYIVPAGTDPGTISRIQSAIMNAAADPALASDRAELFLSNLTVANPERYDEINAIEATAINAGYPVLR